MSCEYAKEKDSAIFCNLTGKLCLVIKDEDRTAYRHCTRREWAHKLEDQHSSLLARPCSALDDMAPQVAQDAPRTPLSH